MTPERQHPSTPSLRQAAGDPLAFLEALAAGGGDVVPCAIGRRQAFLLTQPAHVEDVLVRRPGAFVKGKGYQRAARLMGSGLLTAEGRLHAERRRLLQPAFHRPQVATYGRAMVERAAGVRDRWTAGVPLDLAREMQALTFAIIGETLFGADLACRAEEVRRVVASALSPLDGLRAVVAPPRRARQARLAIERIVDDLIARRLQSAVRHDDLLARLLAHDAGDPQQVRDDAVTLLLAGHDTVAHALTWTWLLLADHPAIGARMHDEVTRVLEGRLPAVEDLGALTYTRGVFAESLRLRPPAWVIVREAAEASRIGDVSIPAGALVIVSPWVLHRDPRFFPDPLRFDPLRWMPAAPADRPKLAYIPFGAGSRSCIGEHVAWMEGTLVLATIAQRWRLVRDTQAAIACDPRITLRSKGPVAMVPLDADAR